MAWNIFIKKVMENEIFAEYEFGDPEHESGVLRINKSSGKVTLLQPAPNDDKKQRYVRAGAKLRKYWEAAEYPERTRWAT